MTSSARSWPLPCLALALGACDLGLDPSMVGGDGGSASSMSTSTSSSTADVTGTGPGSGSTASTTTSGAGGDGGAGAGGKDPGTTSSTASTTGAGGGGITWVPCAPPEDFALPFFLGDSLDEWLPAGNLSLVNQGDLVLRMEANATDATLTRDVDSTMTSCFLSAVLEEDGNEAFYLLADCEPGTVQFLLDFDTHAMSVDITAPPVATPEPSPFVLPLDPDYPAVLRVLFEGPGGDITFQLKEPGAGGFVDRITMPQPAWMDACKVGIGTSSGAGIRVDDICVDAP